MALSNVNKKLIMAISFLLFFTIVINPAEAVILGNGVSYNVSLSGITIPGADNVVYDLMTIDPPYGNKIMNININYNYLATTYCILMKLQVYADGVLVYQSGDLFTDSSWKTLNINIPFTNGVSNVQLKTGTFRTYGGGSSYRVKIDGTYLVGADVADNVTVIQAINAANNANASAQGAKVSADKASNQTWYTGTYGGTSESVANIAGYIRNTQLPGIDTKISNLDTKINNLQTSVTNIQNSDTIPPTVDVQTVSGARATSGSSIQAVVTVADNRPGPFTYSINGGSYSALPSDGRISLPVSSPGNNTITVFVKDVAGNVGSKTIVIRKL